MIRALTTNLVLATSWVIGSLLPNAYAQGGNTDQFTYLDERSSSPNNQYPPQQWQQVRCDDLMECVGWPEKFVAAPDWTLRQNDCRWCPASGNSCGAHHQSPINLERNRAIESSPFHNQCIDVHRMIYFDSSCTFDELKRLEAFSIERYALKIRQPIEEFQNGYRVACSDDGRYRWGRLDYSRGFSDWWFLSHTDIHVPSEHTQDGKRYDAEIQMYQFYSVNASVAGVPNQMGTVSIFMEAYDDAEDYDVLNKLICQWRRVEDETRAQCGMPSVASSYPGCPTYRRGANRNLRTSTKAKSIQDVLAEKMESALGDPDTPIEPLVMVDPEDGKEVTEQDWEEYMDTISLLHEEQRRSRHLEGYENVPWSNYFGLIDVKTEYYFRYSGTQTIPPCFGVWTPGPNNRANTNHWRVLKDPIRISHRQLNELHRLLKNRIAPSDDPIRACRPDTAGRPYEGNSDWVNMSRPLQSTHTAHFKVFCECQWRSRFGEDHAWCTNFNQMERLYEHPYNFRTDGF